MTFLPGLTDAMEAAATPIAYEYTIEFAEHHWPTRRAAEFRYAIKLAAQSVLAAFPACEWSEQAMGELLLHDARRLALYVL